MLFYFNKLSLHPRNNHFMTNVAIIDTAPMVIRNLFNFVLDKDVHTRNIKSKSKEFLKQELNDATKEIFTDTLESFSFYNTSMYIVSNPEQEEQLLNLVIVLSDLKSELLSTLSQAKKIDYKELGKLERRVSPPLKAYEFIGNNKTDIKYSNKSFGLLFE